MRSTHTPTSIFVSPKFTHPYHPQNCTKSPRNSINHFDNHFDTHPKYPLTNTANKLSDKLKITQNLPIPQNHPTFIPTHTPIKHPNYLLTKPLYRKKHPSKPHLTTEHIPLSPKIGTKIRPESIAPKSQITQTKPHPPPLSFYC